MSTFPTPAGPNLQQLLQLFPSAYDLADHENIPAAALPPLYRELLVPEHHMTRAMETFYHDRSAVRILARQCQGDLYARKILLTMLKTGQAVLYAVSQTDLSCCNPRARAAILAGRIPLGRILIQHQMQCRVQPTAFLRVTPGLAMRDWFGLAECTPTYGRLVLIYCNDKPAIEAVEIIAPVTQAL